MKIINSFLFLITTISASADINTDMQSYFNGIGISSNVTSPSVYQGQEASYYSGGSLYMRTPNKDLQFAQITAPSLTAGCGGIDLFMGGFSFINSTQLVEFAQNMLSEAAPVAFNIALQTMSPTLSNVFQAFEQYANMINEGNLNSCQADYAIAGALTQGTAANQYACQDLNAQGGQFADWVGSHEGCASSSSGSDYSNVNNNAEGKQETTVNKNLVWAALMQSPMYSGDVALAQFMMSLSGTIVYDQNGNPTPYPPLALDQDMLNAMMYGGNVTVYSCGTDTTNCLSPSTTTITIEQANSFGTMIDSYLEGTNSITSAYLNDQPLTADQEAFLGSVPFPILKFIEVSTASHLNMNMAQFSDAIADSIMVQYLMTSEQTIQQALAETNFSKSDLNKMDKNISQTLSLLSQKLATDQEALNEMMNIINTFSNFNQQVVSGLTSQANSNYNFDPYGTAQP